MEIYIPNGSPLKSIGFNMFNGIPVPGDYYAMLLNHTYSPSITDRLSTDLTGFEVTGAWYSMGHAKLTFTDRETINGKTVRTIDPIKFPALSTDQIIEATIDGNTDAAVGIDGIVHDITFCAVYQSGSNRIAFIEDLRTTGLLGTSEMLPYEVPVLNRAELRIK